MLQKISRFVVLSPFAGDVNVYIRCFIYLRANGLTLAAPAYTESARLTAVRRVGRGCVRFFYGPSTAQHICGRAAHRNVSLGFLDLMDLVYMKELR